MLPDVADCVRPRGDSRGIRLIHTHLRGEPLTRDDLVDSRATCASIWWLRSSSGRGVSRDRSAGPNNVRPTRGARRIARSAPYRSVSPRAHVDVAGLMAGLGDRVFAPGPRARKSPRRTGGPSSFHVGDRSGGPGALGEAEESLRELRELARTAGVEVIDALIQMRDHVDPKHVMGKGKLEEVVMRAIELDAAVSRRGPRALARAGQRDRQANGSQGHRIGPSSFSTSSPSARRAGTASSRVELAQLKYAMPRLAQKDDSLSRRSPAASGGRGPGETVLEIGRRRAKERVTHSSNQLKQLASSASRGAASAPARAVTDGGHRPATPTPQEHAAQTR